jgi:hypothetical protein
LELTVDADGGVVVAVAQSPDAAEEDAPDAPLGAAVALPAPPGAGVVLLVAAAPVEALVDPAAAVLRVVEVPAGLPTLKFLPFRLACTSADKSVSNVNVALRPVTLIAFSAITVFDCWIATL